MLATKNVLEKYNKQFLQFSGQTFGCQAKILRRLKNSFGGNSVCQIYYIDNKEVDIGIPPVIGNK